MAGASFIRADHPETGVMFACVDDSARFTIATVAATRLAAMLAPYPDAKAAKAALVAAGGVLEEGGRQ